METNMNLNMNAGSGSIIVPTISITVMTRFIGIGGTMNSSGRIGIIIGIPGLSGIHITIIIGITRIRPTAIIQNHINYGGDIDTTDQVHPQGVLMAAG